MEKISGWIRGWNGYGIFGSAGGVFKVSDASSISFGTGNASYANAELDTSRTARTETTTHGKQKGVKYIIKVL